MPDAMTIPSRVECIDDVRRWVSARAQAAHASPRAVADIELALTEALANVIEHGYGGDTTREIRVEADAAAGSFRVAVRDWGRAADPARFTRRDLDDPGEGGYGVYLIEGLMDDVRREAQPDGGTLLTLVKRLQPQDNPGRS
jgi:serine/threonine-protein kinase RsbW